MPNIQTAKDIAENALRTIGAFPASQTAPDPRELNITLKWLEMLLSFQSGISPLAGYWQVFDIPIEAGIGDYDMADYSDGRGVCYVFSASIVYSNGTIEPMSFEYESTAAHENLSETGVPTRATVSKDRDMVLKVYPTPTQENEDAGLVIRVRVQTYNNIIDPSGIADVDIQLRPAWYLWITERLAYEIGKGAVRRLAESELTRLKKDADDKEKLLLARDGNYQSPSPPVTEPMAGSFDYDPYINSSYKPSGYN